MKSILSSTTAIIRLLRKYSELSVIGNQILAGRKGKGYPCCGNFKDSEYEMFYNFVVTDDCAKNLFRNLGYTHVSIKFNNEDHIITL